LPQFREPFERPLRANPSPPANSSEGSPAQFLTPITNIGRPIAEGVILAALNRRPKPIDIAAHKQETVVVDAWKQILGMMPESRLPTFLMFLKRASIYGAGGAIFLLLRGLMRGALSLEWLLLALATGAFIALFLAGGGWLWASYVMRLR